MSHIFESVPSRRLGRSLGINLVPFKTCSYDCLYCQLGRTTNKTTERHEWVPLDEVLAELKGINTSDKAVRDLVDCASRIKPDRIQLNTATRPPADNRVAAVSKDRMEQIARQFSPTAEIILADYRGVHAQTDFKNLKNHVQELLSRRPCTLDDITLGLDIHRNEAVKYIEELQAAGVLTTTRNGDRIFYKTTKKGTES